MPIVPGFEDFGSSQEIFDLVWRDDLTGLFNRRFFARYMKQVADWSEGGPPVCLAMMDMDNLKRVNDRLGHLSGDTCLQRIGAIMKEVVPEGCYPVRYAGDEFALVLPGMTREAALQLADVLRNQVARDAYEGANLPEGLRPSLSIGLAVFPEDAPAGGDDLTETADKALYHSKRSGKNKVTDAATLIAGDETISDLEALSGFPAKSLVGREAAFATVDEALSLVLDEKNALLLVEGDPGTGKTRLLSEIAQYAREREVAVLIERCNAVHREDPYRTLAGLLDRTLRRDRAQLRAVQMAIEPNQRLALREIMPVFRPRRAPSSGGRRRRPPQQRPARELPREAGWVLKEGNEQATSHGPGKESPSTEKLVRKPSPSTEKLVRKPSPSPSEASPDATADVLSPGESAPGGGPREANETVDEPVFADEAPQAASAPRSAAKERPADDSDSPEPPASKAHNRPDELSNSLVDVTPEGERPSYPVDRVTPKPGGSSSSGAESTPRRSKRPKGEGSRTKSPPPTQGMRVQPKEEQRPKPPRTTALPRRPAGPSGGQPRSPARRQPRSGGQPPTQVQRRRPGPGTASNPRAPGTPASPSALPPTQPMRRRRPPPRRLSKEELTVNLFSGLQVVLRELTRERAYVILLDDVDAADEATFELIRQLLGQPGRLLFVASARNAARDMQSVPYHAFRKVFPELNARFHVELTPFNEAQTVALTTTLLEGFEPPERLSTPIYRFSQGNPLFIEGVLRHLIEAQLLERVEDGWRAAEALPQEIPLTLEDLIRSQLAVLTPEASAFLREAAVVGPNFDFNVLKVSAGKPEGEALDLVGEAVREKLIRETGAGAGQPDLEFSSTVVQETSYQGLGEEERKAAHERVAEAISEAPGEPAEKDAALAYHFGKAGNQQQRERFMRRVRERRALLFNRAAIETILSSGSNLPEVTDPPSLNLTAQLPRLAKALATAAKVTRQYTRDSKVVEDAFQSLDDALGKAHEHAESFTIGHRGNAFVLNGHPVDSAYASGQNQEVVVGLYRVNSIKSLTFVKQAQPPELMAFFQECAKHTVHVPLERYFWRVFAKDHDLVRLGVGQKTSALKQPHSGAAWTLPGSKSGPALAQEELRLVGEILHSFIATAQELRKFHPGHEVPTATQAKLDRALHQLFEVVPGLAIHEGEDGGLVVNGIDLEGKALGKAGPGFATFLRRTGLRGLVILKEITPRELGRFMEKIAALPARPPSTPPSAPSEAVNAIGADGSFPNVVVGEALFELAHGLVQGRGGAQTEVDSELELTLEDAPPIEELLPLREREVELPADFEWPSDGVYEHAHRLWRLRPLELLDKAAAGGEFLDTIERLLLDGTREASEAARLLLERIAINFASQDTRDRRRTGEVFLGLARKGTQEVRSRFFKASLRRLADALELESDADTFERLAECGKHALLDRIAQGDWDHAAKLSRALGLRRATTSSQSGLKVTSQRVLDEVLRDPRTDRLIETIEGGSQQERRKAARVLETMGDVAVNRLVVMLKATERGRVETFLIDMLAALVPTSETALRKEVTPSSPSAPTIKVLRATGVVCRDATPVFVSGLQHDDRDVQAASLTEARKVGGKVAQDVLRWALAHGSAQVQLEAVKSLGDIARPDAVASMISLAQGSNLVEVQRECCLAFGKLALSRSHTERVVPVLATFLSPGFLRKDFHPDVRHAATWALGQMTDNDGARRALSKALHDNDKRVRLTAKLTLEQKGAK